MTDVEKAPTRLITHQGSIIKETQPDGRPKFSAMAVHEPFDGFRVFQ